MSIVLRVPWFIGLGVWGWWSRYSNRLDVFRPLVSVWLLGAVRVETGLAVSGVGVLFLYCGWELTS